MYSAIWDVVSKNGEKNNSKYIKKYGLSLDLLGNMLNPSEYSWSPKIVLKIQDKIGGVKKNYYLTVLII